MLVSPFLQAGINTVLVRINQCTWINGVFDQWLDRLLLHIVQHINDNLPTTVNYSKDWWSFLLHRTSSTFAFETSTTTFSLLALDHFWLSFMASNHIGFVTLHLVR